MKRSALILMILLAGATRISTAAENHLNAQQQLGRRLYEQSCGVCHTRPTLVSGMYGPELNKQSADGREDIIRETITNGTPRMPAFKYTYDATQVAAIAAYLMTVEPGHQNVPAR